MMQIRRSSERGYFDFGWLKTFHTFSFGDYFDRNFMGFRSLRVINEDAIAPGQGFPTHSHRDMEIITYVTRGSLEHKDSMGNGSIISAGDIQYMSAGSGVTHSEYNPTNTAATSLLQIWIMPSSKADQPRYAQMNFSREKKLDKFCLIVSNDGREQSIAIRQDASIYACILSPEKEISLPQTSNYHFGWLQIISGGIEVGENMLKKGDAIAFSNEWPTLKSINEETELLYFALT